METVPVARRLPLAVFAAVCLAGAELAQLAVEPDGAAMLPAFWPPAGVLVAALLTTERRYWISYVVTAGAALLLSDVVLHGRGPWHGVVVSIVTALDAIAIATLVRRALDRPFALDRLSHVSAFVAAIASVPIAGGLIAGALLAGGWPPAGMWRAWWLGEINGSIVTAPIILAALAAPSSPFAWLRSRKAVEGAIALAAGSIVAVAIFGARVPPVFRVPAYTLPFLLWPIFRFGPGGGSAAALVLTFIGFWHAVRGQVPISFFNEANLVTRVQGAMVMVSGSLLLLSSVVAERRRVARERDALVADLKQALAEIKTLRGLIPICAWCHKIRDDAGFWQQLEQYFDARTDATFSHGICPDCITREARALEGAGATGADAFAGDSPAGYN